MRRYSPVLLSIAVLTVVLLFASPAVAAASDPVVTITVVGPDGKAVTGAKVTLYDTAGNKYENTTDINGVTKITVPSNATYLLVVKSEYYVLDTVTVSGDTEKTVNASAMHHVNITSTPLSVDTTVMLLAFNYVKLTVTTNVTVYAPSDLNITFPSEIVSFPYKYTFDKIKYDGVETNETTVTIDMARDYTVTGCYTKTFYMTLEYWMVIALVVIVIAALAIAWSAGARTARAAIAEWRARSRRFVKKK
ncbi:MAG: hypothetical protein DRN30_06980 [Thermoplasmata archaeon]|nr:MAG: hypothetical protein DRN30_06980 [Thermoplasmata archaeon]